MCTNELTTLDYQIVKRSTNNTHNKAISSRQTELIMSIFVIYDTDMWRSANSIDSQ